MLFYSKVLSRTGLSNLHLKNIDNPKRHFQKVLNGLLNFAEALQIGNFC